jgi:hypothetical protein
MLGLLYRVLRPYSGMLTFSLSLLTHSSGQSSSSSGLKTEVQHVMKTFQREILCDLGTKIIGNNNGGKYDTVKRRTKGSLLTQSRSKVTIMRSNLIEESIRNIQEVIDLINLVVRLLVLILAPP